MKKHPCGNERWRYEYGNLTSKTQIEVQYYCARALKIRLMRLRKKKRKQEKT